jgi:hypothetical protein
MTIGWDHDSMSKSFICTLSLGNCSKNFWSHHAQMRFQIKNWLGLEIEENNLLFFITSIVYLFAPSK